MGRKEKCALSFGNSQRKTVNARTAVGVRENFSIATETGVVFTKNPVYLAWLIRKASFVVWFSS